MKPQWICKRTSAALIAELCPPRAQETHKGDYGRVLIIGGAEGYTGAPYLAAEAALRTGAGLIFTGVPRSVYPIVAAKLHAPMVFPLADDDGKISLRALPEIFEKLKTADVCLLGPGLGRGQGQEALVLEIVKKCTCPLILDADGINAIAGHMDVLREAACSVVLTPHEGEFRKLVQTSCTDRVLEAKELAKATDAVILRKGHTTVITDGNTTYLNRTGNAGMATGGSGDVLAGILASLIGQGLPVLKAAAAAAWLHGTAGDLAALDLGEYFMAPTDLIGRLSRLLP